MANDAKEWLEKWDAGEPVWSVEMGGIGPGYEQAIQVTAVEILRHLITTEADVANWSDAEAWQVEREAIETALFANPVIEGLGLSGAQWGAAMNLATIFYRRGPADALADEAVKDRKILVSKPSAQFAA